MTAWLYLDADRRLVTGLLSSLVLGTFLAVGTLLPGAGAAITSSDSIDTLFQGLLTATITGVTLVLTLNQVVLSQELGAAGDQRERMRGATTFRDDVADAVGTTVSPAEPSTFLRALVRETGANAHRVHDAARTLDGDPGREIETFADTVCADADRVADGLDGAQFGEFDVVSSALGFEYSRKLVVARRLRERYGERLDAEGRAAFDDLIAVLRLFGPAREHFKTLYFQWDLIELSRRILWSAVPALLVSGTVVAFVDPAGYDVGTLVPVIAVATTVALVPFTVLLAYVLRIATIAKRTLSIGPFVLRESDEDGIGVDRE
ncbi:hypothetical protein BRD17_01395 [Halobacteriales archaeon SW_7_68_16]|nr:MAG: hypothetical protein BRD17_01395 [Halobacteriales archaeon SW_7_68_16]